MGTCFSFGNRLLKNQITRLQEVKKIALIGAGTMGIGIAIDLLNKTSYELIFIDISNQALARAKRELGRYAEAQVSGGRMLKDQAKSYLERVSFTEQYAVLKDVQIVWEIATERLEIKKKIFAEIEKNCTPEHLVFIYSNTSSHTTGELAVLFKDSFFREKFLTGHGYFPFHLNRLFDVMKGKYASEETFLAGVIFAEQILEKKTMALRRDHHGYIADPIFQGMAAIVSWDVKTGQDLVDLPSVFALMSANPFQVLDRTGHMPYTESGRHLGRALPGEDRLRSIYNQNGLHYPDWIEALSTAGRIGINVEQQEGFFKWEGRPGREKPVGVYDPKSAAYVPFTQPDVKAFWSYEQARALDHREAAIKSPAGLALIAQANDRGGQCFRRYVLPILLYAMDLIQDGYATAGEVNSATKVGLRFKYGLIEIIDAFTAHFGLEGFISLIKKAGLENADRAELYDTDGLIGPRKGRPCLLQTMQRKGWSSLLGYGRIYGTPVSQRDLKTGKLVPYYNDLRYVYPGRKDRVVSIIFDNPLKGNVWNRYTLDQLDHALGITLELYEKGLAGSILFTAAGTHMRMLGADARQFNKGWFDPRTGYRFLGEEQAAYFTKAGMRIFRFLQECPLWTLGVFGEKWGGGAEFVYFLNQRFDLEVHGCEFDTLRRETVYREKSVYNQPEIDYAILAGFGGVQELRRLGFGDSIIDEIFMQGMTAARAYQTGLSNFIHREEAVLLAKGYETARLNSKYAAPYSLELYNTQKKSAFEEGINDEELIRRTGETFNPAKNPYVATGLLRLLNMGGKNPPPLLVPEKDQSGWSDRYRRLFSGTEK
ncbi:MAG: hypothetical protein GXO91_03765 [FCB group bacterium]|nr:hypothetical protein [FCB group bacterium]